MKYQFEVTITDDFWPNLKILVTDHARGTVREEVKQYDLAAKGFEPLVNDKVSQAVNNLIEQRKRR